MPNPITKSFNSKWKQSDLYSFSNWSEQKERIYVRDSAKENDFWHKSADLYETHKHSVDGFVTKSLGWHLILF